MIQATETLLDVLGTAVTSPLDASLHLSRSVTASLQDRRMFYADSRFCVTAVKTCLVPALIRFCCIGEVLASPGRKLQTEKFLDT